MVYEGSGVPVPSANVLVEGRCTLEHTILTVEMKGQCTHSQNGIQEMSNTHLKSDRMPFMKIGMEASCFS